MEFIVEHIFTTTCFMLITSLAVPSDSQHFTSLPMSIQWSDSIRANDYQCTGALVPHNSTYIVRYDPMASDLVHHMLLYGCKLPYSNHKTWDCKGMGRLCGTGQPYILFGWGRNASGIQLPTGVGFRVGERTDINWLVLQLHYGDKVNSAKNHTGSTNGLTIQLTGSPKPSIAGVYILAANGMKSIPPTENVINLDLFCQYHGNPILPFAYRVHAHSLGIKIIGYVVKNNGTDWVELGGRSPQDPQAFYPITHNVTITSGDYLAARCVYSSVAISSVTQIGADTSDEMCNFYFMYSTLNNPSAVSFDECSNPAPPDVEFLEIDDYQCPDIVPPIGWQKKENSLFVDDQWILNNVTDNEAIRLLGVALGQVTAVQARNGRVHVLHRGTVQWDYQSFNQSNYYMNIAAGPIQQSTVLELNSTGHLISQWGKKMFYLPHGLTIDSKGNYWITDVAMHQVFKFSPQRKKVLELGVAFSPGSDHNHFCKPASVAVDGETGVVFVADGYCNSRVVLFSPAGKYLMQQNAAVNNLGIHVVHKVVIVDKLDQLLVADRENGRILAYRLQDMNLLWSMRLPDLGRTVYSIDVNSSGALQMFAVATGANYGVTVDQSGVVLDKWSPPHVKFIKPHDVAMDTDGSAVYVTETGPNRIWKFVRSGSSQMQLHHTGASRTSTSDMRLSTVLTVSSLVHITTSHTSSYLSTLFLTASISASLTPSPSAQLPSSFSIASSTDSQSDLTTTTISSFATLSQLHSSNIQTVSVVSTLLFTAVNNNKSSNNSTGPYRSSEGSSDDHVTALQAVALVLTGLVILVALVIVILTVKYCNYSNVLQPQNLRKKLFKSNGHHGFSKLHTFDPDISDDELTVFTKM